MNLLHNSTFQIIDKTTRKAEFLKVREGRPTNRELLTLGAPHAAVVDGSRIFGMRIKAGISHRRSNYQP